MSPIEPEDLSAIVAAVQHKETVDRPVVTSLRSLWPAITAVVAVSVLCTVQWLQLNTRLDVIEVALKGVVTVDQADRWVDTFAAWHPGEPVPDFRDIRKGEYPSPIDNSRGSSRKEAPARDVGVIRPSSGMKEEEKRM